MYRLTLRSAFALFSLLATGFFATAQEGLPHELTPEERPLIPAYRDSRAGTGRGISTPPNFPVRTMAEFLVEKAFETDRGATYPTGGALGAPGA